VAPQAEKIVIGKAPRKQQIWKQELEYLEMYFIGKILEFYLDTLLSE
jgi:hypothetical protein